MTESHDWLAQPTPGGRYCRRCGRWEAGRTVMAAGTGTCRDDPRHVDEDGFSIVVDGPEAP